jgi:hypothetical protein
MTILRALARPMLASIFIVGGFDTLRRPGRVAKQAGPVVRQLADQLPPCLFRPNQSHWVAPGGTCDQRLA